MTTATHTLTLPVHTPQVFQAPAEEWRRRWRFEANAFTQVLGPRQGIYRLELDRSAGTLTVNYDPERFSLDELKALG